MPAVVRAQLDYYAVLEIAPSADTAEVNAAFRRLAWRYHPDRNPAPGATVQFQDINEAHQVLSDPARRAEYDAQWHPKVGDKPRQQPRTGPALPRPSPMAQAPSPARSSSRAGSRAVCLQRMGGDFHCHDGSALRRIQLRLRCLGAVGWRRRLQLRLFHGDVSGHLRGRSRSRDNRLGNRGAQLLRWLDPHLHRAAGAGARTGRFVNDPEALSSF